MERWRGYLLKGLIIFDWRSLMSINISKVSIYLKLMLDEQTPKKQKFGLLFKANPVQIRALAEIVHNLLLGSLWTLNESLIKLIRKRRKLLLNFSNPERSFKTNLRALRSHYRYFTELLCLASPVILQKNELHSENGVNSDWAVRTTVTKKCSPARESPFLPAHAQSRRRPVFPQNEKPTSGFNWNLMNNE